MNRYTGDTSEGGGREGTQPATGQVGHGQGWCDLRYLYMILSQLPSSTTRNVLVNNMYKTIKIYRAQNEQRFSTNFIYS